MRSVARHNEAEVTLSEHGLNVERLLNDGGKSGLPQPDLRVNGAIADVYSPTTKNVKSVWDAIKEKVDPGNKPQQAPNIVVNLVDSPLSASDVAQYVTRNPIARMDSLIIIKNGSVIVLKGGR